MVLTLVSWVVFLSLFPCSSPEKKYRPRVLKMCFRNTTSIWNSQGKNYFTMILRHCLFHCIGIWIDSKNAIKDKTNHWHGIREGRVLTTFIHKIFTTAYGEKHVDKTWKMSVTYSSLLSTSIYGLSCSLWRQSEGMTVTQLNQFLNNKTIFNEIPFFHMRLKDKL